MAEVTIRQFTELLNRSGLAERRPVEDPECIAGMLENADLTVTAWDGDCLIGIARSVTDLVYCCYLSDLAVDRGYQGKGIGRELIAHTQAELGPRCTLILLSAPGAVTYYPEIGMDQHPSAWILPRNRRVVNKT
jgi:GNAT superfamily N-acetyltransferase